jgi:hypothetical protein
LCTWIPPTSFYPFHKEDFIGAFGFNCLAGVVLAVMPIYHMVQMLLLPPGQGVYFQIYDMFQYAK